MPDDHDTPAERHPLQAEFRDASGAPVATVTVPDEVVVDVILDALKVMRNQVRAIEAGILELQR